MPVVPKIKSCKHDLYLTHSRPHRLAARTPGSHPGNRSSILREVTTRDFSSERSFLLATSVERADLPISGCTSVEPGELGNFPVDRSRAQILV